MDKITKAGVYNLPVDDYHADPVEGGSLTSSGARLILEAPAKYKARIDTPQTPTAVFDFGHGAHKEVLGEGAEIVVIDADSWRTNDAKDQRDRAHLNGQIPMLIAEYKRAQAMADVVAAHPIASKLFARGKAEQTLVWQDERTGIWCRALLDFLPDKGDGRFVVPDYKTAVSSRPDKFAKSAAAYGYAQQAAWYLDGVRALGIDTDPGFVFVVQEKEPPYIVTVVELDSVALLIADGLNQQAIDRYIECTRENRWPGYSEQVETVSLPYWWEAQNAEEMVI